MEEKFEQIQVIEFKPKQKKKVLKPEDQTGQNEEKIPKIDNEKRYKQLLERIATTLAKNNPELAQKTKILLKPPQVVRMGKKTAISNFVEICEQLERDYVHVMNFFLLDLGASGSIGDSGFIIKNVLQQKNVQNLFRKYITQFVQCHLCKKQNTQLVKDDKMRLWTLHCKNCNSSRTVPTIKGSKKDRKDQKMDESQLTDIKEDQKEKEVKNENNQIQNKVEEIKQKVVE